MRNQNQKLKDVYTKHGEYDILKTIVNPLKAQSYFVTPVDEFKKVKAAHVG